MDATKSFCIKKAFEAIDDWKYGYIDKKNLKSFLRKHDYVASTSECMAIIRRLDMDADARVSKQEFYAGLRPEEPYSKIIKRKEKLGSRVPSRGRSRSNSQHRVKNAQPLMLKQSQRDAIKTTGIDK